MYEVSIDDRRKILLAILDKIVEVCRKENLSYFLAYGTLLGAVRHKGFIPWDDDADVWVPISHYEYVLNAIYSDGTYAVINNMKDPDWTDPFAKIYDKRTLIVNNNIRQFDPNTVTRSGIAVDIFPLFDVDRYSCSIANDLQHKRNRFYRNKRKFYNGLPKLYLDFFEQLGFGEAYYRKKLVQYEYSNRSTDYIGCPVSPYGQKDKFKKSWFDVIDISFEGKVYCAPKQWDLVLRQLYGDYMTPPPMKDREHSYHHDEIAFWV